MESRGVACHSSGMQQSLPPLSEAYALANSGRIHDAIPLVERHAAAGNGEALFLLGDIYWRGFGVDQDFRRGRELFGRAAEAGNPVAQKAWTNLLGSGIAGARDWPQALERLEREAQTDGLRAQMLSVIRAMELDGEGNPLRVPAGERLAERPKVILYPAVFSRAECDFLRLIAEPTYQRTETVLQPGDTIRAFMRTAQGSTIHWIIEDPASHAINRRLAALTETAVNQGEPLQILRYRPGQEYRPHLDFLDEPNRRILTALIYLNDDYEGGETSFTSIGLNVKGRTGDALVFRSQGADGNVEPLSWHAGLPVIRGTKYLASRWIRERAFRP
jgi:prolyl 4-hydroxylase